MKYYILYLFGIISTALTASHHQSLTLLIAVCDGDTEHVQQLIDRGYNVNVCDPNLGTPLLCAVNKRYTAMVALLLRNNANTKIADLHFKETALHKAVAHGHSLIIQELLAAKADVCQQDRLGNTPLHYAARTGHFDAVKWIMHKCTREQLYILNQAKLTALDVARANNHTEVVELLKDYIAKLTPESNLRIKKRSYCTLL